jgi:hypothetical protein
MALSPREFDVALDRIHQHAAEARVAGDQKALRIALREHIDLLRRQYGVTPDLSGPDGETTPHLLGEPVG